MKFSRSQDVVHKPLFFLISLFNHKEQTMKHWSSWFRSVLAGMAFIAGFGLFTTQALAQIAGVTPSGTNVQNQATLVYSSGTGGAAVAQPNITSNITSFLVDKLVRPLVVESNGAPTTATPNTNFSTFGAGNVTTFTVTNQGNDPQGYSLAGAATAAGSVVLTGTTYTNSITPALTCSTFVDGNANGVYDAADTAVAIPTLATGASATVFVVCNIPAPGGTIVNGAIAVTELTATTTNNSTCTAAGTGCVITTTAGSTALNLPDNTGQVDVVMGDIIAGSAAGDALRDGKHSARDAFVIASATISVVKAQTVLCDPANFAGNGSTIFPRALPGAYLQYTITITNTGSTSATLTTITDALQVANVNIDPDLVTATGALCPSAPQSAAGSGFRVDCPGATNTRTCKTTPKFFTTTSSADGIDFATPNITATFASIITASDAGYVAGELKPTESVVITYNVKIK